MVDIFDKIFLIIIPITYIQQLFLIIKIGKLFLAVKININNSCIKNPNNFYTFNNDEALKNNNNTL
jgi:hypothetical protein